MGTMPRHHVVISGTGRAGTTFLVEILTHLGLDTGFTPQEVDIYRHKNARAGLEHDIREDGSPYVIKNPKFCDHIGEVLKTSDIIVDHVFIPMRDLRAAAESRRLVFRETVSGFALLKRLRFKIKPKEIPGGLWDGKNERNQEAILLHRLYKLILALSGTTIPVTLLQYPLILRDSSYLYEKLRPILEGIDDGKFRVVFDRVVRPEWVHSFNEYDR
jgi:hypothetical protein